MDDNGEPIAQKRGTKPGSPKVPGSGRKPTRQAQAEKLARQSADKYGYIIDDEMINELSPLEIMIFCMKLAFKEKDYDTAFNRAVSAANYIHPRLASTVASVKLDNTMDALSLAQIDAILAVAGESVSGPISIPYQSPQTEHDLTDPDGEEPS